jgi:hypothetical protein
MSAQEIEAVERELYHDTCHHTTYRLTCEEFDALWERSAGRCEICGVIETNTKRGRLNIDHDQRGWHLVRGLLCDLCNSGVMRRVDEGRPEYITEATERYSANPFVPHGSPVPPFINPKNTRAYAARQAIRPARTSVRHIRIEDACWADAQTTAGEQGDNVPDIVRLALRAYVADPTATLVALAQIRGGAR